MSDMSLLSKKYYLEKKKVKELSSLVISASKQYSDGRYSHTCFVESQDFEFLWGGYVDGKRCYLEEVSMKLRIIGDRQSQERTMVC